MRPLFRYFGSKWKVSGKTPAPKYPLVIEPFAGSAGYSTRYEPTSALLVDLNPRVVAIWKYLIAASPEQILALPDVAVSLKEEHLDLDPAARDLIGFWLNTGTTSPRNRPSKWISDPRYEDRLSREGTFWGAAVRQRIAQDIEKLRGWQVICGSYRDLFDLDCQATWTIDPPYQGSASDGARKGAKKKALGVAYPYSDVDFEELADFCRTRRGQVIVHESIGADWLPFEPLTGPSKTRIDRKGGTSEVWWYADNP